MRHQRPALVFAREVSEQLDGESRTRGAVEGTRNGGELPPLLLCGLGGGDLRLVLEVVGTDVPVVGAIVGSHAGAAEVDPERTVVVDGVGEDAVARGIVARDTHAVEVAGDYVAHPGRRRRAAYGVVGRLEDVHALLVAQNHRAGGVRADEVALDPVVATPDVEQDAGREVADRQPPDHAAGGTAADSERFGEAVAGPAKLDLEDRVALARL